MTNHQTNSVVQHCHQVNAPQPDAIKIYELMDAEFDLDGLPVSLFEVDEVRDIWCVAIYCDKELSADTKSRFSDVLMNFDATLKVSSEAIGEQDWVANNLLQLSPVRAGRFLVHGSHDKNAPRFNDYAIQIDAGMAFGTGHHGTTAGCLDMLGDELKRQKFFNPLDVGTGSGVLAIAIAKACRVSVLASDIDPVATSVAQQNARINNTHTQLKCVTAAGFNHREITAKAPYDLIIANILARPLQEMAGEFSNHLAPGATVILSGLLPHQQTRIIAHFKIHGMKLIKSHIRDGWLTLVLRAQ